MLLVIVARPLGACLLLKKPPAACPPLEEAAGCPAALVALASTNLFRAHLLLVIADRLPPAALPLEEPRGGVFAVPFMVTRLRLGCLLPPASLPACFRFPSAACSYPRLSPALWLLALASCRCVCCLLAIRSCVFWFQFRFWHLYVQVPASVHSLVAPLLPALVVSSWLPAGCQHSLHLFLMAPCLRPTAHR